MKCKQLMSNVCLLRGSHNSQNRSTGDTQEPKFQINTDLTHKKLRFFSIALQNSTYF